MNSKGDAWHDPVRTPHSLAGNTCQRLLGYFRELADVLTATCGHNPQDISKPPPVLAVGFCDYSDHATDVGMVLLRMGRQCSTVAGFALAAWLVGRAYRSRITLSENTIEERTLFRTNTLPFDQIRGRREYLHYDRFGGHTRWELVPNSRDLPTVEFGKADFDFDDAFYGWLNKLPSLNESLSG